MLAKTLLVTAIGLFWLAVLLSQAWALNAAPDAAHLDLLSPQAVSAMTASSEQSSAALPSSIASEFQIQAFSYFGGSPATSGGGLRVPWQSWVRGLHMVSDAPAASFGGWTSPTTDRAFWSRIGCTRGPIQVQAFVIGVGAHFAAPVGLRQGSSEDMMLLKDAAGTRRADLNITLKLAPATSLVSRFNTVHNDRPGDSNRGLSTADLSHAITLGLGPSSRLHINLAEHREEWDPDMGKENLHRRTGAAEFTTTFGAGQKSDLRMALTTSRTRTGGQNRLEMVREVHLKFAATPSLSVIADSTAKRDGSGQNQRAESLQGIIQLASGTELWAGAQILTPENGIRTRQSDLKLNTAIGRGDGSWRISAQRKVAKPTDVSGQGLSAGDKHVFTLDLNRAVGATRTGLHAAAEDERALLPARGHNRAAVVRGEYVRGERLRVTAVHERKSAPVAPSGEGAEGTAASVLGHKRSAYDLTAEVGARTKLTARLNSLKAMGAASHGNLAPTTSREVIVEHQARAVRLRTQHELRKQLGPGAQLQVSQFWLDAPAGALPDSVKDIASGFAVAGSTGSPEAPSWASPPGGPDLRGPNPESGTPSENWLHMPFAGSRLWWGSASRDLRLLPGAEQSLSLIRAGARGLGWVQQAAVAGRYHLRAAYQARGGMGRWETPETQDEAGRPSGSGLPLRRKLLEIGAPVRGKLVALARYIGQQSGATDSGVALRWHTLEVGVRGLPSRRRQLEAGVSREISTGAGKARELTGVGISYALRASDEHQLSVKGSCVRGVNWTGAQKAECRLNLDYRKPI